MRDEEFGRGLAGPDLERCSIWRTGGHRGIDLAVDHRILMMPFATLEIFGLLEVSLVQRIIKVSCLKFGRVLMTGYTLGRYGRAGG